MMYVVLCGVYVKLYKNRYALKIVYRSEIGPIVDV